MSQTGDDKQFVQYVLGRLSPAEEARLEAGYLADSRLQEQLLFVEDELVDDYVQDRLSADDRSRLEARFLASPRGRRKLAFANSLARVADERQSQDQDEDEQRLEMTASPSRPRPFLLMPRMVATAAALLVLIGLGLFKLLHQSTPSRSQTEGQAIASPSPSKPTDQISQSSTSSENIFTITLQPTSRNVDHVARAHIPGRAQEVHVRLEVGNAVHDSYRVALVNARDQMKWTGSDLKLKPLDSGRVIDLNWPGSLLEPGEYTILLSPDENGARPIAEYGFVVERIK